MAGSGLRAVERPTTCRSRGEGAGTMRWLVALGIALAMMVLVPWAILAVRKSGRMAGAALAIGLAFSAILDPARAAAIEHIKKKQEIGEEEEGLGEPRD